MTPRDIRRRTVVLFALGIVVPSSLLAYLAFRGIRNDQALLERERRQDLARVLDDVIDAHDATLSGLGRALDSSLALAAPERAIARFVEHTGLVDAAFRVTADDRIDPLLAPNLMYRAEPGASADMPASDAALDRVRRREFAGADAASVLAMYRDILATAPRADVRADALNGAARLQRQLGHWNAALDAYRRLGSEFGDVLTAGGIPFRLMAQLELGSTEHQAGDASSAGRTLLSLFAALLRGDGALSRAQHAFFMRECRERAASVVADITEASTRRLLSDSLEVLARMAEITRQRTERLLLFERSAGAAAVARRSRVAERTDPHPRLALDLQGQSYYVQFASAQAGNTDEGPGTWGLLLNADTLVARLDSSLRARTGAVSVGWTLVDPTGTVLRESDIPVNGVAAVNSGLPGGVPPYTISLYPADAGFVRTLLTSRRGIFSYAFVLIAGILVVGLVLTMNTISHQLELSRMQSDFVSTVSHEFRSPLTAIRQIGEMLQADQVPSESKRRQYYDVLVEQSERLSMLVNRVLDFARMESGQHTFAMQSVNVNAFLDDLVGDVEQRVDHKGFVIRREVERNLPSLKADPDALKQAVSNLIDNAIKYSGDSRELVVRGFTDNGHVVVAVQDFGKGMDTAECSRVFERFYRGGDPLTRSVKGTGLGLTMVQHIIEGHGGRVDVESAPGRGSTFTVRLPVQVPAA